MKTNRLALIIALLFCSAALLNAADQGDAAKTDARTAKRKERLSLPSKGEQKLDVVYKTIGRKSLCVDMYYPAEPGESQSADGHLHPRGRLGCGKQAGHRQRGALAGQH